MTKEFKVYLTNFGFYLKGGLPFHSLKEALKAAEDTTFDCTIYNSHNVIIGYWNYFSGFRQIISEEIIQ